MYVCTYPLSHLPSPVFTFSIVVPCEPLDVLTVVMCLTAWWLLLQNAEDLWETVGNFPYFGDELSFKEIQTRWGWLVSATGQNPDASLSISTTVWEEHPEMLLLPAGPSGAQWAAEPSDCVQSHLHHGMWRSQMLHPGSQKSAEQMLLWSVNTCSAELGFPADSKLLSTKLTGNCSRAVKTIKGCVVCHCPSENRLSNLSSEGQLCHF